MYNKLKWSMTKCFILRLFTVNLFYVWFWCFVIFNEQICNHLWIPTFMWKKQASGKIYSFVIRQKWTIEKYNNFQKCIIAQATIPYICFALLMETHAVKTPCWNSLVHSWYCCYCCPPVPFAPYAPLRATSAHHASHTHTYSPYTCNPKTIKCNLGYIICESKERK